MKFHVFDDSYLAQLRAGDSPTQEHFVAYFSELIQLKVRTRLRSAHDVEDVRQETFRRVLNALQKEGEIRNPECLGAYVNSVCNNVLLEQYRSRPPAEEVEKAENAPDPKADAFELVLSQEMQQRVREILDELPERDRRLLRQIFLEERDKDEVCGELGVTRDYLRVLLHRAKQSFKSVYLKHLAVNIGRVAANRM